jgi:hypothetical protein
MEQEELGFISIEKMDHLFLEQFFNLKGTVFPATLLHQPSFLSSSS